MNKQLYPRRFFWAFWFFLLSGFAGSALATPTFGVRLNNWCALAPIQATAPQQSRPYQAAGSACSMCHTSGNPSGSDLNARGNASATCSGTGSATVCGTVMNQYCVATAPSNATITAPPVGTTVTQGQSVTFTAANATNPDGFPLSYTWLFSGGLANAIGQSVGVAMTATGTITTSLQVRNSVGMLATGAVPTRAVTVSSTANQPPMATIGTPAANVTITAGQSVSFAGSGTDPNNNLPLTYTWSFPGGSPATSTAQNPGAVTYSTAGTYTASFLVRDSLGLASTTVTRTVTVTGGSQTPVATIVSPSGGVTIARNGTVVFQGMGSDPGNNLPLRYEWKFPEGTPSSSELQNPGAVQFKKLGTFRVTLRITNSRGVKSDFATLVVTVVEAVNQPPVATIVTPAANVTITAGQSVSFAGSGTDPNNNLPLTYSWSFPGGSPASSTAQNPGAVTYSTAGTYTVSFTVTDSLGLASITSTRVITVTGATGQFAAIIVEPAIDVSIVRGGTVRFRGAATGSSNRQLRFRWTFQGGTPSSSSAQNPEPVRFGSVGRFTVTLTVTDNTGRRAETATRVITVTRPNQSPGDIGDCRFNDDDDDGDGDGDDDD